MPSWLGFLVLVIAILVAIAPRQVLGPVAGLARRYLGPGVVALIALGAGSYTLGVAATDRAQAIGLGELGLGALCAAWWLYRLFVPAYRDQAADSSFGADDR